MWAILAPSSKQQTLSSGEALRGRLNHDGSPDCVSEPGGSQLLPTSAFWSIFFFTPCSYLHKTRLKDREFANSNMKHDRGSWNLC